MLTCVLAFCLIYVIFGAIGLALKITYHIFKWIFTIALVIGALVVTFVFAIPLLIIIPIAILLYALFCQASEII